MINEFRTIRLMTREILEQSPDTETKFMIATLLLDMAQKVVDSSNETAGMPAIAAEIARVKERLRTAHNLQVFEVQDVPEEYLGLGHA